MGIVRMVGKWKANILYQIANAILRDYHEKKLDEDGVGELFGLCCRSVRTREAAPAGRRSRKSRRLSLNFSCVPMRG